MNNIGKVLRVIEMLNEENRNNFGLRQIQKVEQ